MANQSRVPKDKLPLVIIRAGDVERSTFPAEEMIDETVISNYRARLSIDVDLFTHGTPVVYDGKIVGYDDDAPECLMSFVDFLNSEYVNEWSEKRNVALSIDGRVQSLTGIVNDTNYEYRAKVVVLFSFTEKAIERAAVLDESSIVYDSGEEYPFPKTSSTGEFIAEDEEAYKASIVPVYNDKSICGNKELAAERNGVYEDAEITFIE